MEKYDYIIAGMGAAGLSLAFYMAQSPLLKRKKVLLIDKNPKVQNDRTWCFWQEGTSPYEAILYKKWQKVTIANATWQKNIAIEPYSYKMLRGIDFYTYTQKIIRDNTIFEWLTDEVHSFEVGEKSVRVHTQKHIFEADYVFDGLWEQQNVPAKRKGYHYFLQHFKGWVIQTDTPVFDAQSMTYMDFRVPQEKGEVRFAYVLPFSEQEALVEYTLFSENLLSQEVYEQALKKYITEVLHIKNYQILEQEFGIIPMYDAPFQRSKGRIVQIGTKAGAAKASTGFAFNRMQLHSQAIVKALENQKKAPYFPSSFKYGLYDSALLEVIARNRMPSEEIFVRMFSKHPIKRVFRFLDEQTSLVEELKIMNSMPWAAFMKAIWFNFSQRL